MATSEFARKLLSQHGVCMPQDSSDWSGPFELPTVLTDFYDDVGPCNIDVVGYGNSTIIPSLERLWSYQAGYRWNGLSQDPADDWPPNWLVVADEGADPYIFDMESGRILFAEHGTGSWDAGEIYPNLNTMAACIATLGCVIQDSEDFEDEEFNINPSCRMEAVTRLTDILGSSSDADAVVIMAGWG